MATPSTPERDGGDTGHDGAAQGRSSDPSDTGADAVDRRAEAGAPLEPAPPFTQQVGRVALVVLAVLFGVFAVTNSQFVDFNWVFGSADVETVNGERVGGGVPLIILLILSFVMGSAVGALLVWRRARRGRRDGLDDG